MATVSEVTIKYAARGAKAARKADGRVRDSIQETAKTARSESGTIARWMQRHRQALVGIGLATSAAMMAIVKNSPALSAELSTVRTGFSLLAMQIGNDLAPALRGLGDASLGIADAYSNLPGPIRTGISALIGLTLAVGSLAGLLAGLQTVISGTFVATLGSKAVTAIAGFVSGSLAAAAAVGVAIGAFGVWILKITGVLDMVGNLGSGIRSFIGGPAADFILTLTAITGILPLLATLGAFVVGFLEGGFSEGFRQAEKVLDTFLGAIGRTFQTIKSKAGGFVGNLGDILKTGIGNIASDAYRWGTDLIDEFMSGLNKRIGDIEELAGDIKERISDKLGFDNIQNDRMARRWGSDLIQEFNKGMANERTNLTRTAGSSQAGMAGAMQRSPDRRSGGSGSSPVVVQFERGAIRQREDGTAEVKKENVSQQQGSAFASRSNI